MSTSDGATSAFISAPDGLRLHARLYGPAGAAGMAVVCLPGLARTAADFETLAAAVAGDIKQPRRVVALDYRGRGQSDYDRNPDNYSFPTELSDLLAVVTALDCLPAVFVGTSRGGILIMLLAAQRPTAIAGCVLNDIGPVIEPRGLLRIRGYVGKLPRPRSFEDGAEVLRRLFSTQFPKLTTADWLAAAHRTFKRQRGRLVPTYDVRLARTLKGIDFDRPLPTLWKEFDALAHVPLMVVRGANSDILSPETVEAMRRHHPGMEAIEVADQGHAPLLADDDAIAAVADFVRRCEASYPQPRQDAQA